jgi:hypothetical protein
MALFDKKQKMTEIDLEWQKADYVSTLVCVENDDMDKDPSGLQFAWFKTEASSNPTDIEEKERIQAMQVQFAQKVINKYGLPYGMAKSKELKEIIKEKEKEQKISKWDKKRKKIIDKQIEKDIKLQRERERKEFNLLKNFPPGPSNPIKKI